MCICGIINPYLKLQAWGLLIITVITEQKRKDLVRHIVRTGVSARELLLRCRKGTPKKLTVKTIKGWQSGAILDANDADLEWVFATLRALPDANKHDSGKRIETPPKSKIPSRRLEDLSDDVVTIDAAMRVKLLALKEESGLGPQALLKGQRGKAPKGLHSSTIYRWMNKTGTSAKREHLDYVIARWEAIIRDGKSRVTITPELFKIMQDHRSRSRISGTRLIKTADGVPDGLSYPMVNMWLSGKHKIARRDHLEFVLKRWAEMPDNAPHQSFLDKRGYKSIPRNRFERLMHLKKISGLGGETIMAMGDAPEGLNAGVINNWFRGETKSARDDHMTYVLETVEGYCAKNPPKIEFTAAMGLELKKHRQRSGIPQGELLKRMACVPKGLSAGHISKWINNPPNTVNADHYEFVLKAWEALPNKVS